MQLDPVDRVSLISKKSFKSTLSNSSFQSCIDEPRFRTLELSCCAKFGIASLGVITTLVAVIHLWFHPLWHVLENVVLFDKAARDLILYYGSYASIPLVAAIVGWGTNAVAISMTFYPLEFVGFCPSVQFYGMPICGWQGIIPSSARKMAAEAVEQMITKLFDASEAAGRLDPERFALELRPALESLIPRIVETIGLEYAPEIWKRLPESVKSEIVTKNMESSSRAISGMMGGSNQDIGSVVDMKLILVDLLVKDKRLINDIFLKCAGKEYQFIRVSGFYLGFIFGLVQMGIWWKCQDWWVLPVAGFLVGYLTNFVALKCIFLPVEPRYICGIKFHGLFLQRQGEVAAVYAELFACNVLNSENLLRGMIESSGSDALFKVLDDNVKQGIDTIAKRVVLSRRLAGLMIGRRKYGAIKAKVSLLIRDDIEAFLPHVTPYIDEALDVQTTLETSMNQLTSAEFSDMLLPAFKEGELKLIVIGGILGALVGMVQALIQVPDQFGLA